MKFPDAAYLRLISSAGFSDKIAAFATVLQQNFLWQISDRFGFLFFPNFLLLKFSIDLWHFSFSVFLLSL